MVEIKIRHKNCRMHLILEHKITVIIGKSATGKSTIHKSQLLKDALSHTKISDSRFSILHISGLSAFKAALNNNQESLKQYFIYVIDEGSLNIDDDIASIIKRSTNCYFIITSRGGLGKLNFDLKAVKELITLDNGVTIFKDYVETTKQTTHDTKSIKLQHIMIEDTTKAKDWFAVLFEKLQVDIESAPSGKDTICNSLFNWLSNNTGNILIIFDECSFGNNVTKFKGIVDQYDSRVVILSDYKSWEYLLLNSNMFKSQFKPYDITIPNFEEAYYEELLLNISSNSDSNKSRVYTTINHDSSSKLSKCYTEKCCAYLGKNKTRCNYGLKGEDKFVALLQGTIFEGLLIIARRI